jgi:YHS domain-containing protein
VSASERTTFGQNKVEVETACGSMIMLTDDTPRSIYQGRALYFCLQECKAKFETHPLSSCLTEHLQSQDN